MSNRATLELSEGYPPPPLSWEIETAPRERLAEIQDAALRRLIQRAWHHVPFYRERWEAQGIRPEEIQRQGDLRKLPVVSKRDFEESLLRHPPFGNYQGNFPTARIQASSGSTGEPKPFFQTLHDWKTITNFWARRLHAQGVRQGDIVQVAFTYSLFIVGFTATEGAMQLGALVVPTGSGAVTPSERQVKIALEWRTNVLMGTPSYVLHLADVAERMGLDPSKDFRLRITVHTSEALTEPMRKVIQERWGVQAYDNFGSVETGSPTFECEEKNGYHINEDGYIFEVLDPESHEPVAPSENGVLVVTSLFKEAAPVIRYNLEDTSSLLERACPCGRTFRRLAKIKGRVDEMVKVRGVGFYPTAMEGVLERFPELTHEYLFILDRTGQQDTVTVRLECRREDGDRSLLKEKLERELKVTTGLSMEAQILKPGELRQDLKIEERIKAKRVWDRRK